MHITLYCDHDYRDPALDCNKYHNVNINDVDITIREVIRQSKWGIDEEGNTYCMEHHE